MAKLSEVPQIAEAIGPVSPMLLKKREHRERREEGRQAKGKREGRKKIYSA